MSVVIRTKTDGVVVKRYRQQSGETDEQMMVRAQQDIQTFYDESMFEAVNVEFGTKGITGGRKRGAWMLEVTLPGQSAKTIPHRFNSEANAEKAGKKLYGGIRGATWTPVPAGD